MSVSSKSRAPRAVDVAAGAPGDSCGRSGTGQLTMAGNWLPEGLQPPDWLGAIVISLFLVGGGVVLEWWEALPLLGAVVIFSHQHDRP